MLGEDSLYMQQQSTFKNRFAVKARLDFLTCRGKRGLEISGDHVLDPYQKLKLIYFKAQRDQSLQKESQLFLKLAGINIA
jgi:hypothetical protein